MTITPPTPLTLEPWKRTLRTAISVLIAASTAALLIATIPQVNAIDPSSRTGLIIGYVTVVASAITRFAASNAGNYVFGLIGLDAAHVINVKAATAQTVNDVIPVVTPVVAAVQTPTVDTVLAAADAVTVAAPIVQADVATTVAAVSAPPPLTVAETATAPVAETSATSVPVVGQ